MVQLEQSFVNLISMASWNMFSTKLHPVAVTCFSAVFKWFTYLSTSARNNRFDLLIKRDTHFQQEQNIRPF